MVCVNVEVNKFFCSASVPPSLSSKVRDRLRSSSSPLPYHCVAPFPKPLAPAVGVLGLRCFFGTVRLVFEFLLVLPVMG